ncbi:CCAAT/enhancer-binding protein beta-like [Paramacrobiotus metropolitanus]|uniref:CCAAT/enhancer-binding protein beta-like n=1 Tax=Paramacrobiotus metropolitanus TaxID=2943436 RepID=UPI00244649FC|nr:CCAAT/enhancer-binding protein beta-like [Paramacrobiotus metropolitanus]
MSPPSLTKRGFYSPGSPADVPSPDGSNDSAIESCYSGTPPPSENVPAPRKRKAVDKESEQYKARRERNNEAVRKSRAKSKLKRLQTDTQLKQLQSDKSRLELQVEMLQKELHLIRSWVGQQPKMEPGEAEAAQTGGGTVSAISPKHAK